jgi:predicted ABC-class ATPase
VVPFQSAAALQVTLSLPNPIMLGGEQQTSISGMGIPKGVTLIVGGGYHGKSTLLDALEHGVYPHIPGDGREYVVSTRDAVKIRAEDGRRVEQVDISAFISNLPYGRSTSAFSTDDASGSTSQAANIVEALEVGATALLLDEDTSATNFMVRDARMQALVHKEHEPITPFLDRVRDLYDTLGVSTILVLGGSGDYFDVADTVIMLRDYLPHDVTEAAREVARAYPTQRQQETTAPLRALTPRIPQAQSFDPSRGKRDVKIDVRDRDVIVFGTDTIVLRAVEQLVDRSQTRAVGYALHAAATNLMDGKATLRDVLAALETLFDQEGLDALDPFRRDERHPGNFARPRSYEVMAAINRLRTVQMRQDTRRE